MRLIWLSGRLSGGVRRAAESMAWLSVEQAVRTLVGLLVGAYVARHLGPESFGLLNVAISFAFLFSVVAQLGLNSVVVRDLVACAEQETAILSAAFVLRIAGALVAASAAVAMAWAIQEDATTRLAILIIVGGMLFEPLDIAVSWFQARVLAQPIALARLSGLTIATMLRLLFIMLDKPVIWFAWPVMLDVAASMIIIGILFYTHRKAQLGLNWRLSARRMRSLLGQAWPLAASGVAVQVHQRIDQIILGHVLSHQEAGWYAAAGRVSQCLYVMPVVVTTTLLPFVIHAKHRSHNSYVKGMQRLFDFLLWASLGLALVFTAWSNQIVYLLYGEAYRPTGEILQIHAWSLVFVSIGIARRQYLLAERLNVYALIASITGMTANIGCNFVLIPKYGGLGAAWAMLISTAVSSYLISLGFRQTRAAGVMATTALFAPLRWLIYGWQKCRVGAPRP